MSPAGRAPLARRIAVAGAALAGAWVLVEVLMHAFPGVLPASYRESFPAHGIELFRPGVLAETPSDGLPVPLVPVPWDGPPPADLVEMGVAPPDVDVDRRRHPRVRLPADARGLPNRVARERADVVLVGDSFLVSAGSVDPPGLVPRLEEVLGVPVYSLGVAGIGPLREAWLLERVGLPLRPRLVVWFFFGGNDLNDAKVVLERRATGRSSHADLEGYRAPPPLRSLDLLRHWIGGAEEPREPPLGPTPLPPLRVRLGEDEGTESVWFHPAHLSRLAIARAGWEGHVAWAAVADALERARDLSSAAGARLVVVYLPSKAEALLPRIASDPGELWRHLTFGMEAPPGLAPEEGRRRLLENRSALAAAVAAFCERAGIPFLSATPALEELARRGASGYLATDTHWSPEGMEAVLVALVEWLASHELLPPGVGAW